MLRRNAFRCSAQFFAPDTSWRVRGRGSTGMTLGRWARSAVCRRRPGAPSGAPVHSSGQSGSAFRSDGAKLLGLPLAGLLDLHLISADGLAHRLDMLSALRPDHDLLAQAGALLDHWN